MAVDAGGLQGDGGDAAVLAARRRVAAGRACGRGTRGRCRSRRGWPRRRPSGCASPTSMPAACACWTGRRRPAWHRPRPAAALARVACGRVGRGAGRGGAVWLAADMADSTMGTGTRAKEVRRGSRHRHQPSQRDRPRPRASAAGGRHQTSGPKTLPSPVEPPGRACEARSTRNSNGHRHRTMWSRIGEPKFLARWRRGTRQIREPGTGAWRLRGGRVARPHRRSVAAPPRLRSPAATSRYHQPPEQKPKTPLAPLPGRRTWPRCSLGMGRRAADFTGDVERHQTGTR